MVAEVRIREFEDDDAEPLTALLHRAYAELGARGLNFTAVDQSVRTTLFRASGGRCLVALDGGEPVATITISLPPGRTLATLTPEAALPHRAWLNQLAVDPDRRGTGLATRLWHLGRDWAREQGADTIGVDTAEPAAHLADLYLRWGFTPAGSIQWPGKTYRSTVLLSPLTT